MEIHFIHVRSPHEDASPLMMTHGWPGSVVELLEAIGPLTDPPRTAAPRRRVPSGAPVPCRIRLPGEPTEPAGTSALSGRPWAELMRGLGYTRYVAKGATWAPPSPTPWTTGARWAARQPHEPPHGGAPAIGEPQPTESDQDARRPRPSPTFWRNRPRLLPGVATRAQTSLRPAGFTSRRGLAADHETDSYENISRAFVDGQPVGNLTRDKHRHNLTLYWLTGTAASAARSYWEDDEHWPQRLRAARLPRRSRSGRLHYLPRRDLGHPAQLGRGLLPGHRYFNEVDKGGHFAAWEEPDLFPSEFARRSGRFGRRASSNASPCSLDAASGGSTSSHPVPPSCAGTTVSERDE